MTKEERLKQIDLEIEILEKKLERIKRLEQELFELQLMKARLPIYFDCISFFYKDCTSILT